MTFSRWSLLHRRIGRGIHSNSEKDDIMAGGGCDERLHIFHILRSSALVDGAVRIGRTSSTRTHHG